LTCAAAACANCAAVSSRELFAKDLPSVSEI